MYEFENRTLEFAKEVIKVCKKNLSDPVNTEIIKQLVRSTGSIGANYREANDSLGQRDKIMRMKIARKEANETTYWLEILRDNCNNQIVFDELIKESIEIRKILSAIIKSLNA